MEVLVLNLALIGIDHTTADIEIREQLSLTEHEIGILLARLKARDGISGAVILSTCNRTELYLSCERPLNDAECRDVFCRELGFLRPDSRNYMYQKKGDEAVCYLFELACGIHSMIFGDDQITAQVNAANVFAHELGASDSVLNALFRNAVTCAKKSRSSVTLKAVSPSVATGAVEMLDDYLEKNPGAKALVIGNGEIGRIAAASLAKKGCEVYMTLRTYKYRQNVIPEGCVAIPYEKRSGMFSEADIVISATKSPHQTVSYQAVADCRRRPAYIIDLALPRDIDPKVGELEDVLYFNIDDIGKNSRCGNVKEIKMIRDIIAIQTRKFNEWLMYRKRIKDRMPEECSI